MSRLRGDPFADCEAGAPVAPVGSLTLLAPCEPTKVVCAGRNYRSLLAEQGRDVPDVPFLFLKAPNAVVGPGARVFYPAGVADLAHEGELAVVIRRRSSRLLASEVADAVLGYTCANDLTVRDWQDPNSQWLRAKSSDTHCPLGPWIETDLADPGDVEVRTTVNGELRQQGRTNDQVYGVEELLCFITAHMTLQPGDVVLTGTAAGIRPVQVGDTMTVQAEGIGALTNTVEPWPERPAD